MDVVDGYAAFWRLPLSPLGTNPPIPGTGSLQNPRGVLVPAFAHASPPFPPPSLMGAMIAGGEGVLPIQAAFFRTSLDPA